MWENCCRSTSACSSVDRKRKIVLVLAEGKLRKNHHLHAVNMVLLHVRERVHCLSIWALSAWYNARHLLDKLRLWEVHTFFSEVEARTHLIDTSVTKVVVNSGFHNGVVA